MNFQKSIEDVLQGPSSPLSLANGKWTVSERKKLWQELGSSIFDRHLDALQECIIIVLSERDPQFDLPPEDRYLAQIQGKTPKYSSELRKGLAETLALLGTNSEALINCSHNKPENTAALSVRKILENKDWVLWGSLNDLLPIIAEAAPGEFLDAVDNALQRIPCPFDELFVQEAGGIMGRNYLAGLLWALETLAWDAEYLVQACMILGDLATRDPGGDWANRPANSLTTILMPWLPQTIASIDKRTVAVKTLQSEVPQIAWDLLLSLLPKRHQTSTHTPKPSWRNTIPEDWEEGVSDSEYRKQVDCYAELAVSMARNDIGKLTELVNTLESLPQSPLDKLLDCLASKAIRSQTDDQRMELWNSLTSVFVEHRRFPEAEKTLSDKIVSRIEDIATKLAPQNPFNLHRRLFVENEWDLYEDLENLDEARKKLECRRQQALRDIIADTGTEGVIHFSEIVESPRTVGDSLGTFASPEDDMHVLPAMLATENRKLGEFTAQFIQSSQRNRGWIWVDQLDRSDWSVTQTSQFLAYLQFTGETWRRVTDWLGKDENKYWSRVVPVFVRPDSDLGFGIDKLLEYDRPNAAIACLRMILYEKDLTLDSQQCTRALLAAVHSNEKLIGLDLSLVVQFIEALQDDSSVDPGELGNIEWAYLSLLTLRQDVSPKTLSNRLASDPVFFCETIRSIYRSKKKVELNEESDSQDRVRVAENAYRLLNAWNIPPGTQTNGTFLSDKLIQWLEQVKQACDESGHLAHALIHVGEVLYFAPADSKGLWIHDEVAKVLNARDAEQMRTGFNTKVVNSRGAFFVDPTGQPERDLSKKWRQRADDVENAGYQRFAVSLRALAERYYQEGERIVAEHKK